MALKRTVKHSHIELVYFEPVYLVTTFVPSLTACFANSPGSNNLTAVWISLLDILLYWVNLLASVANRSIAVHDRYGFSIDTRKTHQICFISLLQCRALESKIGLEILNNLSNYLCLHRALPPVLFMLLKYCIIYWLALIGILNIAF